MITIETETGYQLPFKTMGFSGGERHVQIEPNQAIEPTKLIYRARLNSSDDVFDLLNLHSAASRLYVNAKHYLEMPYLPYARQDRVCAPGQAFGLEMFIKLIRTAGFEEVAVWDAHSWRSLLLLGGPVEVKPQKIINQDRVLRDLCLLPNSIIVSPDAGAVQRTTDVANFFVKEDILRCEKKRDPFTGALTGLHIPEMDFSGKVLVIVDDICDGGWTFTNLAEELWKRKPACVYLYVTHGIFSRGLEALQPGKLFGHVWCSNSKPLPSDHVKHPNFLTQIDYSYEF
jgi:ribose-phosphate pyrophosphokinase